MSEVRRLFEATFAYGRLLGVDTVTLTRDARLGCARVLELGVEAALRMGLRTFVRYEPISTPQGYFTSLWVSQQHPKTMGSGHYGVPQPEAIHRGQVHRADGSRHRPGLRPARRPDQSARALP